MSSFEVANSVPLSVQAADILRAQILRGDFALGQRINEVEVANALGISRSPLREGLRTVGERTFPWTSDFHLVILEVAGNRKLREHGWAVHTQLRLARFRSGAVSDSVRAAHAEHVAILDALRAHDAVEAERRVREHHERGAAHILQSLNDAR